MEKEISYREVLDAVKLLDKMGMAENFSQIEARTQESLLEIAKNESQNKKLYTRTYHVSSILLRCWSPS